MSPPVIRSRMAGVVAREANEPRNDSRRNGALACTPPADKVLIAVQARGKVTTRPADGVKALAKRRSLVRIGRKIPPHPLHRSIPTSASPA